MRTLLALFLLLTGFHGQALAQAPDSGGKCVASATAGAPITRAIFVQDWNCSADSPVSLEPERILVRLAVEGETERPLAIEAQRGIFDTVHIAAIDADGRFETRAWQLSQTQPVVGGETFTLPVPQAETVVVAFDHAADRRLVKSLTLAERGDAQTQVGDRMVLIIAALAGMLLMPLLFGLVIYHVLRERFALWHAATAATLLLTVVANSGLATPLFGASSEALVRFSILATGLSVAAVVSFAISFIEAEAIAPPMRKLAKAAVVWAAFLGVAVAGFPFVGRSWIFDGFFLGFLPILLFLPVLLFDALRRGSRYARYVVIGLAPLVLLGIWRMLGQFTPIGAQGDAMLLFYIGCVFEEVAVTLGVADRFLALRRDRDQARARAAELDLESRRDSLTGLLNRRVLGEEAARLGERTAVAVLDIDHFKPINDTYGHAVGDKVLAAIGRTLLHTPNIDAIRLGGEEFMILTSRPDPRLRLEKLRVALSRAVARAVPEIEWPVTASMGAVILGDAVSHDGFDLEMAYARADAMLYSAKEGGRDAVRIATLEMSERAPEKASDISGRAAA